MEPDEIFEEEPQYSDAAEMPEDDGQGKEPDADSPAYIPPTAPSRPIAALPAVATPAAKKRRQRRAKRRWRKARRAARRTGTITASGACCGLSGDDGDTRSVTFDLYKTGSGWSAVLRFPWHGKTLSLATSPSPTKAAATRKSANMAAKLARNPLVQAAMPPQARMALRAVDSSAGRATLKAARKLF